MKELKDILGMVAEGLKSFSGSIGVLAGMIDEVAGKIKVDEPVQKETAKKTESVKQPVKQTKKSSSPKIAAGKPAKKPLSSTKSAAKNKKTSAEIVLALLNQADKGLTAAEVMAKTGYDKKKVANIFYRLKAKDDVKNDKDGIYYYNSNKHDQTMLKAK